MRRSLSAVLAAVAILATACASAPPKPTAPPVDLVKADALVAEGCYDCLIEAHDLYQQAAAIPRLRLSVLTRLFESTVLIGLRLKELALDPSVRFADARALVPELPATYDSTTYLKVAAAILPDGNGTPGIEMSRLTRPGNADLDAWKTALTGGEGSQPFRTYLSLGLDCAVGRRLPIAGGGQSATTPAPAAGTEPQLVVYRRAMCPSADRVMLTGLAEADERMIEAGVFGGRMRSRTLNGKEIAAAKAWLLAADKKWPDSPVVTYALGMLFQTIGDCKAALGYYDRTIALRPQHEDGHLGRLICLSYTRQHEAAIAQGTVMINDKANEGEARFWRAWNYREVAKLTEARADSDRMKQILYNDRAMLLAGQIEYDQTDLDVSDKDLKAAFTLNPNACAAPWYLGLVSLKRQAWIPTAEWFVSAMDCYETAVTYDKEKLEEMRKADVDESFRAVQIAGFEAAIRDDTSQVSASALNAAVNYARANDRQKSLKYCDLADRDPNRKTQVAELRAILIK